MKNVYFHLFLFIGLVTTSFAQSQKDTTIKVPNRALTFDISQYLPQITPKSPNVTAMERFGDIAVNLNNGLADISIPIFEIKAGSLSIPIKLMYHHAGNKVSEHASWVGQGWSTSLFSISRNVRGRADEDIGNGGVLGQNLYNLDNYLTNISCLTEQLRIDLDLIADGKDVERDIFTVSSPTKNNSFALLPDGAFWLQSDKSKVTYTTGLQNLNLTDENGIRFSFTDKEYTNSYPSVWYLTEVQGNKPTDKVFFSYQDNDATPFFTAERTDYEVYNTDINGLDGNTINGGLVSITNADNSPAIYMRLLNEIHFPNGKIIFNTSSNRVDNLGKSLSNIEIYGFNPNTASYSLIKKFVMVQSYKDGRLFLDGVDLYDNNGTKIGSYHCTYNDTALPAKDSKSKDYWGFYNGQSNTTLIPAQSFQAVERIGGPLYTYNVGGANRNPNEYFMQARILTQLTYPTGGFTTFEYEAHRHDGGQLAGGLRIKKTVSNDGNNKTITRTYKYGNSENGDGTYRNITPFTYSTVQYQKHPRNPFANSNSPYYLDYYYNIRVFSSSFITPQSTNEGSPVTYPIVTEYQDDGAGTNGKTVYLFDDGNGDDLVTLSSTAKNFYRSRHWSRGQLLEKTVYGSNGAKKYKQVNTYTTISNGVSPTLGYIVGRSEVQLNYYTVNNQGCLQNYSVFTPIRNMYWAYGLRKPIRSEEYFYDDTDDSRYVYKKTETNFDNNYFQLKETRNYQSDGKISIQKVRYVTDFDTHNPTFFNTNSPLYWMRENNQLNTPIEQIQLVKLPYESNNRVLDGQITDFLTSVYNGYNYVYPKEIYLFENPNFPTVITESSFSPSYLSVGVLWKDFRYVLRLKSDNYDSYGNLLSYKLTGGATTQFVYSTGLFNNVFHPIVTSETKNFGGNTVLTTNFSYDLPLLGVKEIIAPNGLKTTFEYDNFGRFKRAKDHSGNIVKEHDYRMGADNTFIKEYIPRVAMGSLSGDYNNYQTTTKYFDGLGRMLQSVGYLAGFNASNDIVTDATSYDNYGRTEKAYIPFPNSGGGSQASLPSTVHGDSAPYSNVSEYDNSPLNRPKKSFGAGQAWRNANRFTETKYLIVPSGTITKYEPTTNGAIISGTWGEALHKNVYISEQGKRVIEYKDNQGKLIQKDVQDGAGSYASTHYIYDEFDRLKYIIQPELFKTPSNFTENDTYFQAGVFGYKYDKRHRVVENHVPSGGWTYVVYDKLNRIVLKQTEKQRPNSRWKFVKYDAHSREYLKGELSSSSSRQSLQNDFEGITNAFDDGSPQSFPSSVTIATNEDREIRIYDGYGFAANEWLFNANPNYQAFHSQYTNATGLLTALITRDPVNPSKVYHNVYYYDNKGRVIQTYQTHHLGGSQHWTKPIITNTQYNFVGQPLTILVATQRDGQAVILDKTENEYDHVGRITKAFHSINGNRTEMVRYAYDQVGRLIQKKLRPDANFVVGGTKDYIQRPSIDGHVTQPNTQDIARKAVILEPKTTIDATGLTSYIAYIDPNAPQGATINGLQTIDYQYHIRNWLRGINLDSSGNPTPNTSEGDLFSYKLDFETEGLYDGNIGKQTWQTTNATNSPTGVKGYSFTYDDANRFKTATFISTNGENYGVQNIDYDKNGNIRTLQRIGKSGNSFALIHPTIHFYS